MSLIDDIEEITLPKEIIKVNEEKVLEINWNKLRQQRDELLLQSDWVVSPDINLSNRYEWFVYRQHLRDIPQKFNNPDDVVWPNTPEIIKPNIENEIILFRTEQFINNFYSPTRLLQMKTWWDEIPHQFTPKLSATYTWIEGITKLAITTNILELTGAETMQPPYTFMDVSQEIRNILYPSEIV